MAEALLAVEDVLRAGVAALGEQGGEHPRLGRERVDGVLHHGQLARGDRAGGAVARGRDADRVLDLFGVEAEHAAGRDRRRGGGEGGVVPAELADAGKRHLAQALLDLVGEGDPEQQVAPRAARALGARQRRGDQVRRV